jgi:hypothetical protein
MTGGAPKPEVEKSCRRDYTPDGSSLAIVRSTRKARRCALEFPIGKEIYRGGALAHGSALFERRNAPALHRAPAVRRRSRSSRHPARGWRQGGDRADAGEPPRPRVEPVGDEVWTTAPLATASSKHSICAAGRGSCSRFRADCICATCTRRSAAHGTGHRVARDDRGHERRRHTARSVVAQLLVRSGHLPGRTTLALRGGGHFGTARLCARSTDRRRWRSAPGYAVACPRQQAGVVVSPVQPAGVVARAGRPGTGATDQSTGI